MVDSMAACLVVFLGNVLFTDNSMLPQVYGLHMSFVYIRLASGMNQEMLFTYYNKTQCMQIITKK